MLSTEVKEVLYENTSIIGAEQVRLNSDSQSRLAVHESADGSACYTS